MQLEVSFEDPDTGNIYKEVMEVNLKPNTGGAKKEKRETDQSGGEVGFHSRTSIPKKLLNSSSMKAVFERCDEFTYKFLWSYPNTGEGLELV